MHVYSSDDSRVGALGLIAVLAVVIAILINRLTAGMNLVPAWLVSAPSVAGSFALLYKGLDRFAWRWTILHRLSVIQAANIAGDYEGKLKSSYGSNTELPVAIQIEQTWTRILIRFHVNEPKSSTSYSLTARLMSLGESSARLTYTYRNEVTPGVAAFGMNDHDGTAEIVIDHATGHATGRYYNFRGRQGTLALSRKGVRG